MSTSPLQSLGALTLWIFYGFKKPYRYYRDRDSILLILIGIVVSFTIIFILGMYTDAFKID